MSKWNCVLCNHNTEGEGGNPWFGPEGGRVCKTCCQTMAKQFFALLLPDAGVSYDEYGPDIHWHEVAKILNAPHERDVAMRCTYYQFHITDKARREAEIL